MTEEDNEPLCAAPVEWSRSEGLIAYPKAVEAMEARVAEIAAGRAREAVWLIEHPPVYTAGTSANVADLVAPERFPVFKTGRGGQYTYHGPGQRVVYVMLDVKKRFGDVREFVRALEGWTIAAIGQFGIASHTTPGRVGVWVRRQHGEPACDPGEGSTQPSGEEDKIAAIGVRLRRWVSFHGIAINVSPDLEHFSGIVPCGISDQGITSLAQLASEVSRHGAGLLRDGAGSELGLELESELGPERRPSLEAYSGLPAAARAKALMDALDEALLTTFSARIGQTIAGEPLLVTA